MLERDAVNLYRSLPSILNTFGINIVPYMNLFEDKILNYADIGIDVITSWLFGKEPSCDVDEAADIAKMLTNDKIEEYRKRVHEAKSNTSITE